MFIIEFFHFSETIGYFQIKNRIFINNFYLCIDIFLKVCLILPISTIFFLFRGPAKFVRIGDLNITSNTDDAEPQDFTIKRGIPHPAYKFPSKYNDIALMELDKEIKRSSYVSMACLDTKRHHDEKFMIATGWGKTEFLGDASSFLLKVDLDIADYTACSKGYAKSPTRELPRGILDDMHICAGGKPKQDTCQVG